jgi:hypothetical protein
LEVQALLGANEALVLFLDVPEETFVWVVTTTDLRWVRSRAGTTALTRDVASLRCGLDAAAWERNAGTECSNLLGYLPSTTTTARCASAA